MSKEVYTYKCIDCRKTFRTDDPNQRVCPKCQKYRKPCRKHRKKKTPTKLTFAEILHIAEVYNKVHNKYLHYGELVNLIEANAEHCVCCGATIPEGRQVCYNCEKVVK